MRKQAVWILLGTMTLVFGSTNSASANARQVPSLVPSALMARTIRIGVNVEAGTNGRSVRELYGVFESTTTSGAPAGNLVEKFEGLTSINARSGARTEAPLGFIVKLGFQLGKKDCKFARNASPEQVTAVLVEDLSGPTSGFVTINGERHNYN
jgi:hypothetical protein